MERTKRSADEWAEWIGQEIVEVHECDANDLEDVGLLRHTGYEIGSPGWVLASTWTATEEDVAAGKAPAVGEILSSTELRIKYCPFCGTQLLDTERSPN